MCSPDDDCTAGLRLLRTLGCLLFLLVTTVLPARAETPYRFGPGDVLTITVFGQQALSGRFQISTEGDVSFPLLGEIPVANLTRPELEDKISHLLAQQLPGTGRISVDVAEYAPVFILGDVEKPGRYEFRPGMIPLELLALGGGDGLVMVLLGGIETLTGPVVGAAIFTWLRDLLARETEFWRAALGLLILLIVVAFPQGLVGGLKALYARWRPA